MARWHLFLLLLLICLAVKAAAAPVAKPGCPETCGNISIPYPFGIRDGCSIDKQWFDLTCNETYNPPKLFMIGYEVLEIYVQRSQARVNTFVASNCYNSSGFVGGYDSDMTLLETGPYTFSNTRNKFTALGCDTEAYITGYLRDSNSNFTSGCVSFCSDEGTITNGTCSGIGCCQTSIPIGAIEFQVTVNSSYNHNSVLDFNPCSYAFLIADDGFEFNKNDLAINGTYGDGKNKVVPVVVDWAIGNETCESAKRNLSAYACKSVNSTCDNSTNGPGYLCLCSQGYEGNPYIEGGCKDINECITGNYTCPAGKCKNTEGGYECTRNVHPVLVVILGVGSSFLFVLFAGSFIYWGLKKRKIILLKEKFFRQNGGLLLQQQITSHGITVTTKIFSAEELERATNNYAEHRIIGRGAYGTVYKGVLPDNTIVAIKKSKVVDETQIEQFINEVFVLSQINHRNVVKLLGCCLETEVPSLVYEFISNGTLYHHIHDEEHSSSISFGDRLRIASETAGALDYLHSAASIPIFHRDVKSTNILLDDNLMAKVSDFGASRLVPLDQTRLNTLVQGTLGYLDPEYFQTGQLTEKSDVYSFGVVLVELLTGEKPICMKRSQEERNLSMYFISSMKGNRLFGVLENRVVDEGGVEQLLAVARLAKRCLKVKGEERPTMKEVAMELEGLRRFVEHPWVQSNHEEAQSLLGELEMRYSGNGNAAGQESLNNRTMSALEIGR